MGQTHRPGVLANLDAEKLELLNELAKQTRVPRAVLLREAVDDLLTKYGMQALIASPAASNVLSFKTRDALAADRFFDPLAREFGFKDSGEMLRRFQKLKPERKSKPKRRS